MSPTYRSMSVVSAICMTSETSNVRHLVVFARPLYGAFCLRLCRDFIRFERRLPPPQLAVCGGRAEWARGEKGVWGVARAAIAQWSILPSTAMPSPSKDWPINPCGEITRPLVGCGATGSRNGAKDKSTWGQFWPRL